jgi:hypothetical protein
VQRLHALVRSEQPLAAGPALLPIDAFDLIWAEETKWLVSGQLSEAVQYLSSA